MTTNAIPEPRPADGDGRLLLTLNVNGQLRDVRALPHHTLLDVLIRECGLTGTREGCGVGMCGACTVLIDGLPFSACLLLAFQSESHEIETIEGLGSDRGPLNPIQDAYVAATGFQCSYCTPGFILTTKALLAECPDADDESARHYLSGNLCRCGSYVKILDAVRAAKAGINRPPAAQVFPSDGGEQP